MCVRERERERESVCVCEYTRMGVCVCVRERECVYVCYCPAAPRLKKVHFDNVLKVLYYHTLILYLIY